MMLTIKKKTPLLQAPWGDVFATAKEPTTDSIMIASKAE